MTTIVVVKKNGQAAIAADSLTTFGDMRLSSDFDVAHDKIMHCGDSYVGLAGSAAHQLVGGAARQPDMGIAAVHDLVVRHVEVRG